MGVKKLDGRSFLRNLFLHAAGLRPASATQRPARLGGSIAPERGADGARGARDPSTQGRAR